MANDEHIIEPNVLLRIGHTWGSALHDIFTYCASSSRDCIIAIQRENIDVNYTVFIISPKTFLTSVTYYNSFHISICLPNQSYCFIVCLSMDLLVTMGLV